MNRILIVEDDEIQRIALQDDIQKHYPSWTIHSAASYDSAQNLLLKSLETKEYYSVFLLDIQLDHTPGDMGGFVIAEQIRSHTPYQKTPILFLTSVTEKTQFALSTYHCYNYITKPFTTEAILEQIRQMLLTGYLEEQFIAITDTDRIGHRIPLKEILYIEAKSHRIVIYTLHEEITSRSSSFSALEEFLSSDFIQCHKKYFINLSYTESYTKTNSYINIHGTILPVSRTYKPALENSLYSRGFLL